MEATADKRAEDATNRAEKQEKQNKHISDSINNLGARIGCLEATADNSANDAESPSKKGKTES